MKKNLLIYSMAVVVALVFASCGGSKKNDNKNNTDSTQQESATIKNLKDASVGETTASTKYAEFAKKAKEEGYLSIAKMFEATSKSESIHAQNHLKVLEGLGVTFEPKADTFSIGTTLENLTAALEGETYEVETMYADFIKQAEVDKEDKAVQTFTYAIDTEKKHIKLYQSAIDAVNADKEKSLAAEYYVCPKCGFTYDKNDVKENCELCGTSKEKFYVIE
ncbi:MAG: rubrerythrin [Bacteroidetes bacterium HGW-Bacteroidetes-6]|jgi:rubrerythrin|nr:MAG: rubrerythrin [Bacteroidetes bacterium HGW-Bacteroidetes-6]